MKAYNSREISSIIFKNIIVIVVFALIGMFGFLGIAKHKRTTDYTAQTNIMISHNLNQTNSKAKQTSADLSRVKSYEDIIEDPMISRRAYTYLSRKDRAKISADEINHSVKASSNFHSLILNINAKAKTATLATHVVNATAKATQKDLPRTVPDAGQVTIISRAKSNEAVSHTHPSYKKYGIVGFAFGALVGMVIAFVATSWRQVVAKK